MKKTLQFLCFFVCGLLLFSVTALAYIDPSAMTYMIQLVAGIVIAAGAAFGFYFRKLKRALSKFGKKNRTAGGRSDSRWEDDEDDDDTGYDDYEIGPAEKTAAGMPSAAAPAAVPGTAAGISGAPAGAAFAAPASAVPGGLPGESAGAAFAAVQTAAGQMPAHAMDDLTASLPVDEYDENGGEAGLLAENRELRRLLAEERRKVEVLKQSLHICTEPKK